MEEIIKRRIFRTRLWGWVWGLANAAVAGLNAAQGGEHVWWALVAAFVGGACCAVAVFAEQIEAA